MIFLHMYTAAAEAETQVTFADDVRIIQWVAGIRNEAQASQRGIVFKGNLTVRQCSYHCTYTFNVPRQVL